MKKRSIIIVIIAVLVLLVLGFMVIGNEKYTNVLGKDEITGEWGKVDTNEIVEENDKGNSNNQIVLNDELEYNSKGKVVAKKVFRVKELSNSELSNVTKDSVIIISKEDLETINVNSIINLLKKEVVVLLKYDDLKDDMIFYESKGIKGREYDTSKEEMKKYENNGYINLELKENEKILMDTYLFKAENDENLLKYINMSIKML